MATSGVKWGGKLARDGASGRHRDSGRNIHGGINLIASERGGGGGGGGGGGRIAFPFDETRSRQHLISRPPPLANC